MSKQPTHTPGPWRVDASDFDRFGKTVWVEAVDGNFICELVHDTGHHEFDNANLIAAAPDLLEACQNAYIELKALWGIYDAQGQQDGFTRNHVDEHAIEQLRAAIAKASSAN